MMALLACRSRAALEGFPNATLGEYSERFTEAQKRRSALATSP